MNTEPTPLRDMLERAASRVALDDDGMPVDVAIHQLRDDARQESWMQRIPRRFVNADVDHISDAAVRHALVDWATNSTSNLILTGPVGSGKTYAAVAVGKERHLSGEPVRFAPVVDLLDALRPDGDKTTATACADAAVLILDDLGAERATDWTAERLYALVNRRWLDERPTIVTTNLDPAALQEAIGERMYSRLVHEATGIRIGGADRRRA
jgi:DNA replication protein DnaC